MGISEPWNWIGRTLIQFPPMLFFRFRKVQDLTLLFADWQLPPEPMWLMLNCRWLAAVDVGANRGRAPFEPLPPAPPDLRFSHFIVCSIVAVLQFLPDSGGTAVLSTFLLVWCS